MSRKSFAFLSRTALATTMLFAPQSILAQDAETSSDAGTSAEAQPDPGADTGSPVGPEPEAIVVTGTRILRPDLDTAVPITSLSAQELTQTGDVSIGDALNDLPSLRSTFSQSNSTRFIGTAGLNALDLRGLGVNRTLTLVNGRRHITGNPGIFTVDVNTIPVDLIDRVDVITGGNSAIYGSDAVAGVVNFVLKRDFKGLQIRARGGISDESDRETFLISATGGTNFADGRGNIAGSVEYSFSNDLYYTDRDSRYGAFSGRNQFNIVENTIGEPASGNGFYDNAFLRGVRNLSISEGGAFTSVCPSAAAAGETAAAFAARRALNCTGERGPAAPGQIGPELGRVFVFDAAGNLVPNIPLRDLRPFGSGNGVGGLGSTLRLTGQLQPQLERAQFNLLANYEVSNAFRLFLEAKYARIDAIQEGQPTFISGTLNPTFSIDNPFLTSQARSLLTQSLAPGATTFNIQRFNVDFGGRGEQHRRETFRVVLGADGNFNDDWRYEVAFNYGRLDTFYATEGNVHVGRFNNAKNAVRNSSGQIVCAINADAIATNDDPACVPVNLFGFGSPTKAQLDYFVVRSTRDQEAEQYNATAFISGDSSQLFELPGGPVRFAIGGEYRRESAAQQYDDLSASGATFLNAIPDFEAPAYEIWEAFGELNFPILKDRPLFEELSFDAAGRVSNYNVGRTGTVFAYNLGLTWAPIQDVRFRASYGRSVRAPTLSDLFATNTQTFLNGLVDPCGQQNINDNPNRVRNCAAAGVPTTQTFNGTTEAFTNRPASGISGLTGSNPDLNEERGTSFTVGAILQPRVVPGLTVTVDYYNIEVKDLIVALGAQTIINQCYDNPSGINNPFCAVIQRNPNGTFAGQSNVLHGGSTVSFPTTGASFISGPFNFARQVTSGVDIDAQYRKKFANGWNLNLRGILSYVIRRDNYTDIVQPDFRDQQLLELGDPRWEGSFTANLDMGKLDIGYDLRWIGRQVIATNYEDQFSVQGRPPRNADAFENPWYPNVFYHDVKFGYDFDKRFRIYGGVDNLFDREPPLGLDGTGAGSGIYDNVGRFFYLGAQAKF